MIARERKSFYYFIDPTWHRPKGYAQLFIILFKDNIIKEKIPLFFILMSNKKEESYKRVFNSIIEILTQNFIYDLPLKSITTDSEISLINAVEETFVGLQQIGCFYHFLMIVQCRFVFRIFTRIFQYICSLVKPITAISSHIPKKNSSTKFIMIFKI